MKKSLSTLILISLITLLALPAAIPVSALIDPGDTSVLPSQTGSTGGGIITSPDQIDSLLKNLTDWFLRIVLIVAVIFILVAAWTFLTAGGNPDSITKARQMLIYALIGIAVAVLAYGLPKLIENILTEKI